MDEIFFIIIYGNLIFIEGRNGDVLRWAHELHAGTRNEDKECEKNHYNRGFYKVFPLFDIKFLHKSFVSNIILLVISFDNRFKMTFI